MSDKMKDLLFDNITEKKCAWIGMNPDDRRIYVRFDGSPYEGEIGFYVINGAWKGVLSRDEDGVLSIRNLMGKHSPVYIVEIHDISEPDLENEAGHE